jgi:hypothetical protein
MIRAFPYNQSFIWEPFRCRRGRSHDRQADYDGIDLRLEYLCLDAQTVYLFAYIIQKLLMNDFNYTRSTTNRIMSILFIILRDLL